MPNENFRSKEAYRRWNAYRHMHGIPAPHLKTVTIRGKKHKVKHSKPREGGGSGAEKSGSLRDMR